MLQQVQERQRAGGCVADALALAVAPSTGRFRPALAAGERVRAGDVLGHVTGGRQRADVVVAPVDACVAELLVRPGQLVAVGEAVAWLECDEPSEGVW